MKKILTLMSVAMFCLVAQAQIVTPQPSVHSEQETTVGLTDIEIKYSRPNKNGRVIFGNLVPYGKIWRTGANENTTISFSDDVSVDGKPLKAGKYAIYTKPEKDAWEIYFYTDHNNWGNPEKWDDAKVAAKVTTKAVHVPGMHTETFLISIGDLTPNSAQLNFLWDDVIAQLKIEVPTDKKVMASIEKTMKEKPSAKDYLAAANYYYNSGKDIQQAKKWVDEGMKLTQKPAYYQIYQQALIYRKAGEVKGANDLALKALEAAKAAGNEDYVKLSQDALREWGKR